MKIFTQNLNIKTLLFTALIAVLAFPAKLFAQPPTIQYAQFSYTFSVGRSIGALRPSAAGSVNPAAYFNKSYPTAGNDSLTGYTAFVADVNGNEYALNATSVLQPDLSSNNNPTTIASGFINAKGIATNNKTEFGNESDEHLYVTDVGNSVYPGGKVYRILTNSVTYGKVNSVTEIDKGYSFVGLQYVAADPAGNVFVPDNGDNAIVEIPVNGSAPFKYGPAISSPQFIAVDNCDNIYYTQTGVAAIMELPVGTTTPVLVGNISNKIVNALNIDANGNLFVSYTIGTDFNRGGVLEYWANNNGGPINIAPSAGLGPVYGSGVDGYGNLYAFDFNSKAGFDYIDEIPASGGYYLQEALPAGLNFNTRTGVFAGTPTKEAPAYNCVVTAVNDNGSSMASFQLKVTPPRYIATLDSIVLKKGPLMPLFDKKITNYNVVVAANTKTENFTPYATVTGEKITINGKSIGSGITSVGYPLNVGPNIFYIKTVSADNTVTIIDTIAVTCKSAIQKLANLSINPGAFTFHPYTYNYNVNVTSSPVTLTPTANAADTGYMIKVNGVPVSSGTASQPIAISGSKALIPVVYISADKIDSTTYYVTVNISGSPQPLSLARANDNVIVPYPVPLRNTLNLNLGTNNIGNVSVEIYGILDGKKVYTKNYKNQSGVLQLDVSNFRSGIYTLHLVTDNIEKIFKIIK